MVSQWFTDEWATWWHCQACDVYGTVQVCWSCHQPTATVRARNPLGPSSYQVHTNDRRDSTIGGRYVRFDPVDELLEGAA